jgi:hypothetical protein
MPFAVELSLDAESGGAVRAAWQRLAEAGIRFMADSGADPHVSVAIWQGLDLRHAASEIATLAAGTATIPLTFTAVRAFGADVVYLAVSPSRRLIDFQACVHLHVDPFGEGAWPHYDPAAWVPHCTLAMDLATGDVATALAVASMLALPLSGRLERMAIVEFRPVRERFSRPLTGG